MIQLKRKIMRAAMLVSVGFIFLNCNTAKAATGSEIPGNVYVDSYIGENGQVKNTTKKRILVGSTGRIEVRFGAGDQIKNLTCSKPKYMDVRETSYYSSNTSNYGDSYITMMAHKAGTYTIKFDVVNKAGAKRGSYSVTVQAVNSDSLLKKATFGNQVVISRNVKVKNGAIERKNIINYKVSGKSGKLKLVPNSQYKITGIIVATSRNGKFSYKKVKNGKSITLSNTRLKDRKESNGDREKSEKIRTVIFVSYKDKFFGDTVKYSISKKRGVKEIKKVTKNGKIGYVNVDYYEFNGGTFELFQY